jgi:hypothetical protein
MPTETHIVGLEAKLQLLEAMLRIRVFETAANQLSLSAKMPGLTHLSIGDEAVAVGVCSALRVDDVITSTHRGHGHCIAKGADVRLMFCELLGKEENAPQAAILAVGRILDRVVAVDGEPAVRPTMTVTLSFDHRVVDGAEGARFLDTLAGLIEEPAGLVR